MALVLNGVYTVGQALAGIVLGVIFKPDVPLGLEPYLPIAVVAALDAVFGGLRAYLDGRVGDLQPVLDKRRLY